MKKCILIVFAVISLFCFSSCDSENESVSYTPYYGFTEMNEEASSFLADPNISNADKNNAVGEMTEYAIAQAEKYRILIKEEYKRKLDEYETYEIYKGFDLSYDDFCKELDEYFDYLRDEYTANAEFYDNQAFIIYGAGTAGASYKAHKEYDCARIYLEKAETFYNEVTAW